MNKHRCGGTLIPTKLKIKKKIGFAFQTFTVEGYKCDNCGDEILSREIALEIDKSIKQLKQLWRNWRIPADSKMTPSIYSQGTKGSSIEESSAVTNNVRDIYFSR